jgi:fluoride exporter
MTVILVLVALGGAAGSVMRYLVDGWVLARTGTLFPYGTLVINLSGSFVLGLLAALAIDRALLPAEIRAPLMIGFLGAYTTFSTLMLESWRLLEGGEAALAFVNAAGSVALGLIAVAAGLALGRAIA